MAKQLKVMIVDDASMMRLIVSQMLENEGSFKIVARCSNGKEALDKLKEAAPDLISLDIEMPVMDGLTFLRHARLRTRAKIVVLSSVAPTGSPKASEAKRLGADAVITKPSGSVSFDLEEAQGSTIIRTMKRLAAAP